MRSGSTRHGSTTASCCRLRLPGGPAGRVRPLDQLFDQTVDGRHRRRRTPTPTSPAAPATTSSSASSATTGSRATARSSTTPARSPSTCRPATRSTDPRQSVEDYAGPGTDGNDYIEGNGGSDVIYGDLGQDDLVGGSSNDVRPDRRATSAPTAATPSSAAPAPAIGLNDLGRPRPRTATRTTPTRSSATTATSTGSSAPAASPPTDAYGAAKPRAAFLALQLRQRTRRDRDASSRGPGRCSTTRSARARAPTDIGGADLIHGEAGDDVILGETGNDVLFGDGQDDTIIGGTGNDRIYGGTGDDAILGDDGYFNTSRNGLAEPLWDVTTPNATDVLVALPGPYTAGARPSGRRAVQRGAAVRLQRRPTRPRAATPTSSTAASATTGSTATGGDDAISGAEALPFYYSDIPQSADPRAVGHRSDQPAAVQPDDDEVRRLQRRRPVVEDLRLHERARRTSASTAPARPGRRSTSSSTSRRTCSTRTASPMLDGSGNPIKSNDGCDIIYGDNGNDWLVGGTDTNWLFGGFGDDLLQSSPEPRDRRRAQPRARGPALWSDPTFAYGGAGRDVLIADTGRARMFDWTGEFNSFIVPFSPFGSPGRQPLVQPVRAATSSRRSSVAGGADQTFVPRLAARRARALRPRRTRYWNAQHGGPRDPQPGNVPGVQIDYRGCVDLGVGCPCNPADVDRGPGRINAVDPLHPTRARERARCRPGRSSPSARRSCSRTSSRTRARSAADRLDHRRQRHAGRSPPTTSTRCTSRVTPTATACSTRARSGCTPRPGRRRRADAARSAATRAHVTVVGYDPVTSVQVTRGRPDRTTRARRRCCRSARTSTRSTRSTRPSPSRPTPRRPARRSPRAPRSCWTYRVSDDLERRRSRSCRSPTTTARPSDTATTGTRCPCSSRSRASSTTSATSTSTACSRSARSGSTPRRGVAGAPTTADGGWQRQHRPRATATDGAGTLRRLATRPTTSAPTGIAPRQGRQRRRPAASDRRRGRQRAPGPIVARGSTVTFSYLVINSSASADPDHRHRRRQRHPVRRPTTSHWATDRSPDS